MNHKLSPRSVFNCLCIRKKSRSRRERAFFNLRVSFTLLTLMTGVFLALGKFVTANPSNGAGQLRGHSSELNSPRAPLGAQSTAGAFARVTPQGVFIENGIASQGQSAARVTPE